MTPHFADDHLTVYIGDCREVMAAMEPESVHCVVTSPPYWGLRDYGTATWVGGDEKCDHTPSIRPRSERPNPSGAGIGKDDYPGQAPMFRDACGKCGARRIDAQLGLEPTPEEYVTNMVGVFREVRRVLRDDGTVWLNLGDSYNNRSVTRRSSHQKGLGFTSEELETSWHEMAAKGRATLSINGGPFSLKEKDLVGIPWRVAFALQADGWYLRSDIIWSKPNPMPESVTDRPTKSHEYLFLLSKSPRYYFDQEAVREGFADDRMGNPGGGGNYMRALYPDRPHAQSGLKKGEWTNGAEQGGRNIRTVWTIATQAYGNVKRERAPGQRDGDDDSGRTVSPDCPVHGDRRPPEPTAGRDAPLAASDPGRSRGNGRHPEPAPLDEPAPIDLPPGADSAAGSSDWPSPECAPTATPRSTGSRRTDPDPETWPRGTDAEGSSSRTGRTRPDADSDASAVRTLWSSTEPGSGAGGRVTSLVERMPDRTTCTCSSWESVSHFAVFPEKLVEPCVKAGCPSDGVVLDPFAGSGTVGRVANRLGRRAILIDLSADYIDQAMLRNAQAPLGLGA